MKKKTLFIFGQSNSGKSTICASIVNHITISDNYIARRNPIGNKEGVMQIRRWMQDINSNKFPIATPLNQYTKVDIGFELEGKKDIYGVTLYEAAGEDVIKFDPTHSDHEDIDDKLVQWLDKSDGIIIVASAIPETASDADIIQDFLEYIFANFPKIPICFILTKCDLISSSYSENYRKAAHDTYRGAIDLLIKYKFSHVLPFSIGLVESSSNIIEENMAFKYIDDIIEWIKLK